MSSPAVSDRENAFISKPAQRLPAPSFHVDQRALESYFLHPNTQCIMASAQHGVIADHNAIMVRFHLATPLCAHY